MTRALIVVDMTYDFLADDGALTGGLPGQQAVQPVLDLLREFAETGELIVFACDAHTVDDPEFALWPPHCVIGTKGAMLYGQLADFYNRHQSDRVRYLPKTKYDAFFDTPLADWLTADQATEVTVVGVCTSICCYATALGAYCRGFSITSDPAAMADLTKEAHDFAVNHMQNVLKAEMINRLS